MKKGIFGILCIIFIYCILNLFVVHNTLIQIEHSEPLNVVAQNSKSIHTEQAENGFITDIVFPSNVFYKHAQIKIKSDILQNVVIKLAGPKVQHKDTYKKYTIDYKNAYINNEEILSKRTTTSFLRPFEYSSDSITTATIDFESRTDFVLRNMSVVHFISMIVILFIMIGYLTFVLYHNLIVRSMVIKFYDVLASKEFLALAINRYKTIRKEYKFCFWVNFLVLNIVYLYLHMNFLHGNHEWKYLNDDLLVNQLYVGRYSIRIINYLTLQKYLPVVNNCLAFVFLALTPIFLVKYYRLAVTKFNIFALSIILLLHPALLNVLYFLFLSYAYVSVPLLLVIGLILSEKKDYKLSIISISILVFTFGIYNISINTLAVIFLGKMLLEYANGNSFTQLFKKYLQTICIILISGIIYILIFQYLKYLDIILEGYNTTLLSFEQILPRILTIFIDSFRHFYVPYSFINLPYLVCLLLLFVPMVLCMIFETIKKKSILYLLGLLFIFVALVFSSNIAYCFSELNVLFIDYVYYFSLPYIYLVAIAYILNSRLVLSKNLLSLLLIPICYLSILQDFECQKYWKKGLEGDKTLILRVIDRIESHDEFLYDKKYNLLFIGNYNSINSSYPRKQSMILSQVMKITFFPSWQITSIGYFMPRTKFNSGSLLTIDNSSEEIKKAFAGIPIKKIINLKSWPNKNSVLVYKDKIIVCWQKEDLEYVKKVLMESE